MDPVGCCPALKALAEERLRRYEPPAGARRETAHWLLSARSKIAAALRAGDLFRAAYVTSVTSWKILEGIWLSNSKPVPAAGGVWAHLDDLTERPPQECLRDLFVGEGAARPDAALQLIDWVLARIEGPRP